MSLFRCGRQSGTREGRPSISLGYWAKLSRSKLPESVIVETATRVRIGNSIDVGATKADAKPLRAYRYPISPSIWSVALVADVLFLANGASGSSNVM